MAGAIQPEDDTDAALVESPDDIFVVAAGGRAGAFSCYIPGWGGKRSPSRDQGGQAMIEVLDPPSRPDAADQVRRPARLLAGKRIGLVENTKFNSDRLLQKIGDILVAEHGRPMRACGASTTRASPRTTRSCRRSRRPAT
jgi:hypothetical protein